MNFDFNSAVAIKTLPTDSIRAKAIEQLEAVKRSLKAEAVKAKEMFNQTAEDDEDEEEVKEPEFFDSIVCDFALMGPLSSFLACNFSIFQGFNAALLMTLGEVFESSKIEPELAREGKLYDYPLGRAQFIIGNKVEDVDDDFNLVSKRMKLGFGATPKAEKKRMYEILDMVDKIEKQGMKNVEVNEKSSIYDDLKSVAEDLSGYANMFADGSERLSYAVA